MHRRTAVPPRLRMTSRQIEDLILEPFMESVPNQQTHSCSISLMDILSRYELS